MHGYQKYQRINVSTADPLRIVIMLYEGAIKNLNQALRLIDGNAAEAGNKIVRAIDIVNYLRNSLDHSKGAEIASNLERLYDYVRDLLTRANIHRDAALIQEGISLLQTLLEGWRGILSNQATEHDAEPEPAAAPTPGVMTGLSMVG